MTNRPVWETGHWDPLPPLQRDAEADLVVIGLGGSGLAAVREAASRGISVIGIDAGAVAGGAAGRNGGFLLEGTSNFYHDAGAALGHERALRLYRVSQHELKRMTAETPDAVRITGSLRIACSPDEVADCRAQLHAMRTDGLEVEWYDGAEGTGLLFPNDGVYQPVARCRALALSAIGAGARLHENTRAISFSGSVVETAAGRIRCRAVIAAVDGAMESMFPELAGRVRTARLQMISTAPAPEVHYPRPVYARYGYEYWQQLPDDRITLGGFRDHFVDEEWTSESTPTAQIQSLIERHLREVLHVRAPIENRWAASVGYTDNGLPVFEEVRPRVWAIGAYSGTGNVVGAACGRAAVSAVMGEETELRGLLQ